MNLLSCKTEFYTLKSLLSFAFKFLFLNGQLSRKLRNGACILTDSKWFKNGSHPKMNLLSCKTEFYTLKSLLSFAFKFLFLIVNLTRK